MYIMRKHRGAGDVVDHTLLTYMTFQIIVDQITHAYWCISFSGAQIILKHRPFNTRSFKYLLLPTFVRGETPRFCAVCHTCQNDFIIYISNFISSESLLAKKSQMCLLLYPSRLSCNCSRCICILCL